MMAPITGSGRTQPKGLDSGSVSGKTRGEGWKTQ